jgi:hypothetical protein
MGWLRARMWEIPTLSSVAGCNTASLEIGFLEFDTQMNEVA